MTTEGEQQNRPEHGDWGGIDVEEAGSADLEGTTLRYASTALSVAERAEVTIQARYSIPLSAWPAVKDLLCPACVRKPRFPVGWDRRA